MNEQHIFSPEFVGAIDPSLGLLVTGWVLKIGAPDPVVLSVNIDGKSQATITANLHRSDAVGRVERTDIGFSFQLPQHLRDGRKHTVELFAEDGRPLVLWNSDNAESTHAWNVQFTSGAQEEASERFAEIYLNAISEAGLVGWARDAYKPHEPLVLSIEIDGKHAGDIACDQFREDIKASGHPTGIVGFKYALPPDYHDGKDHVARFTKKGSGQARIMTANGPEVVWKFKFQRTSLMGFVDGLKDGALRGWVVSRDRRDNSMSVGLDVLITHQGHPIAQVKANQFRADVAETVGCNPNCGFTFVPPPEVFAGKTVDLSFKVIPGQIELPNSPYKVDFPTLVTYQKIRDINQEIDKLFAQLWTLRANAKGLLPADQYTLLSYDQWAQKYLNNLAARPSALSTKKGSARPLISVICPVYRPRIKDFIAAVQSIAAQTYQNWELILVDDASQSPELTQCINQFVKKDARIKKHVKKKNEGISAATNDALKIAKGQYIAFFDHDDLLVERALEIMLAEALRTGAKLLYCDEDKIDDSGVLTEVNLKPDWNYRLLLSQNYVCHLLFVEHKHLKKAGALRSECDGAQDHDLILRLAEITAEDEIHHVPEILYHWRKTPFSTAASGKSKPYTVAAGIKAISDHLTRRGKKAKVTSPLDITCYAVEWTLSRQPKVSIIIPYREHIAMTRECVEALFSVTEYSNFELILVDNWSTSDEALAFADEITKSGRGKVVRVAEPFNYSRINNIAAQHAEGEYLLFMNNDVFVSQPDWLTRMVGEALSDTKNGIVGIKLLYPNKLVQHGGVILGAGGVADHAHRGLAASDPGYMVRAISAQNLSAVTAACMLCRKDAFDSAGGFDEKDLHVAYNDVDLCLKIRSAGYKIVWIPEVIAEHRESMSRGNDFKPEHQVRFFHENQIMQTRWKELIANDPNYNKNFSSRAGMFINLDESSFC